MRRVRIALSTLVLSLLSISLPARPGDACPINERILLGVVSVFSETSNREVARRVDDMYAIVESIPVRQRRHIHPSTILALASLMKHPNNYVKITTANALGDLGSYAAPALPALRAARDFYVEPSAPGVVVAPSVNGVFEIGEAIHKIEANHVDDNPHAE